MDEAMQGDLDEEGMMLEQQLQQEEMEEMEEEEEEEMEWITFH